MNVRLIDSKPVGCETGNPDGLPVFSLLCRYCGILLAVISLLAAPAVSADDKGLSEVRALASSGAASLAIQLLDELQPEVPSSQSEWMALERERIAIYQQSGQWQPLADRLTRFPRNMPLDAVRWAMTERANAFLKLDQPRDALSVLQELVWSLDQAEDNRAWLERWRELIMISYIRMGLADDAYTASRRFYQNYPPKDLEDRLLQARILLMSGHPEYVVEILANDNKDPAADMLSLLAQLRSGARPARKVLQAGLRHLRGKWVKAEFKHHLWAVIAEAGQRSGDRVTTANALEHVLAGQQSRPLPPGLFKYDADSLWNAYVDLATYLGNQQQFLIGDDQPWFAAAKRVERKQPVRARSYYALLMLKGQTAASRNQAVKKFIGLMRKRHRGATLVESLFLNSKQFKSLSNIPQAARLELVDIALARSEIERASELMATIKQAPEGQDNFAWQLRRARILVLGGETRQGRIDLGKLLQRQKKLDPRQLDQVLQVVFDLQTAEAHEDALVLFTSLLRFTQDTKLKRELYYWMAESKKALKEYAAAARFYLKSAMLIGVDAMDPWAQTARYQAGVALAHAGMLDDARALFSHLLRVTKDKSRRAVLRHELQKLWLLEEEHEVHNGEDELITADDAAADPL